MEAQHAEDRSDEGDDDEGAQAANSVIVTVVAALADGSGSKGGTEKEYLSDLMILLRQSMQQADERRKQSTKGMTEFKKDV